MGVAIMALNMTVVVPTYNLGNYLPAMLADLAQQTVPYELWLIDDGSTDGTAETVKAFGETHDWAKVALLPHRGVSVARNYGLLHATGQAISFVDGDDLVTTDFVERLGTGFSRGVVGTVVGYNWWHQPRSKGDQFIRLDQKTMFDQVSEHGTEIGGYTWNKAFRLDLLRKADIVFDEQLVLAEDYLFTANYVAKVPGKYAYWPKVLYTKRNRPSSTIHTVGWEARRSEVAVFARIQHLRNRIA